MLAFRQVVATITKTFADLVPHIVWASAPSYTKEKIPMPYRETMPLSSMDHVYAQTMMTAEVRTRAMLIGTLLLCEELASNMLCCYRHFP